MSKRTNPVMVSVVRALSEEQISVLAAYFSPAKAPGAGVVTADVTQAGIVGFSNFSGARIAMSPWG